MCSAEGEVRGYLPVEPETAEQLIEEKEVRLVTVV